MTEESRHQVLPEDFIPSLAGGGRASRRYAAQMLGINGPGQLGPFLLEAMERGTVPVRRAVSETLGRLLGSSLPGLPGAGAEEAADLSSIPYLDCLLMGIRDPDETTRVNSAGSLARLGESREAVEALALALSDPSAPVRAAAARSLGRHWRSPEVRPPVSALVQALGDAEPEVREAAAGALEYMRAPEARTPLIGLLEDRSREVRIRAALSLGALGAPEAVPLLIEVLRSGGLPSSAPALYLCRMKAQEALPELKAAMKRFDPYGPQRTVARGIANFGASVAVPALCEALEYGGDRKFRIDAIEVLEELGDRSAVPALARALRQWGDPQAVTALLRLGGREAQDAVIRQVNDEVHEAAAERAAVWLGEEGITRAMPALRQAVEQAESTYLVSAAAESLAQLGDTLTGPDMVEWLGHQRPDRRRRAAAALGSLGDENAAGPLVAALRDPDKEVRREAAQSLGWVGDQAAVPALTAAVDDIDEGVREAAGRALEGLARRGY